jgi:hypothetical protein
MSDPMLPMVSDTLWSEEAWGVDTLSRILRAEEGVALPFGAVRGGVGGMASGVSLVIMMSVCCRSV